MIECRRRNIIVYAESSGREPLAEWLNGLDVSVKRKVLSRLRRVECGNYGDYKRLTEMLYELRFANGIRIYFAEFGSNVVLFLSGGDKKKQSKDIDIALAYLEDYLTDIEGKKNDTAV